MLRWQVNFRKFFPFDSDPWFSSAELSQNGRISHRVDENRGESAIVLLQVAQISLEVQLSVEISDTGQPLDYCRSVKI